jgi:hypothetical protein
MRATLIICFLFICLAGTTVSGQERPIVGRSQQLSVRPVEESNVMFQTTLWRRVDLREKQNQPLFAKGKEVTRHLIEGVKAGILDAYSNDSLTKKLTLDQFNERLFKKFEGGGLSKEEIEAGFGGTSKGKTASASSTEDDGWGSGGSTTTTSTTGNDRGWGDDFSDPSALAGGYEMFPEELAVLEIREDWIIDKQRSRQYFDIQVVTIMIPAEASQDGLEKPLASFKFKDLEIYFRNNPNCIWYNTQNSSQHRNLADAFELRLWTGKIIRKSNPLNKYLDDIYKSPKEGLLKAQQLEYELLEFEHNLWEY